MKTPLALVAALLFATAAQAAPADWNGRIYRVGVAANAPASEAIAFETLQAELAASPQVVLGEKHLTPIVQAAQARVILEAGRASGKAAQVAWEFLDYRDHAKVETLYADFDARKITAADLLRGVFGTDTYGSYAPILESARELRAGLVPVNLSRDEKAPVVQGGLAAADPALVPAGFALGDDAYFARFRDAMGGHGSPEQLSNYFAAQCLTDDVMAWHFTRLPEGDIRFLVTGSFHSDFHDGVVQRIGVRSSPTAVKTVRFYDATDYTRADLETGLAALLIDPSYGPVADYVYFVGEPQ
jgi:uncharacterized iron-regulated protein